MWKRANTNTPTTLAVTSETKVPETKPSQATPSSEPTTKASSTLGQSVIIDGTITSQENITIEGQVKGLIESKEHLVVIGKQAAVNAQIVAKDVIVFGEVLGDITASTKIEICPQGKVEGNLASPTVTIAEGAIFRGSIDMTNRSAESAA